MLDEAASRCVAAFDLAIGRCRSYDTCKIDGGAFWQKLLRVADWRESDGLTDRPYYTEGILPKGIKEQMNKPPSIPGLVNESTESALYDGELRRIDERIARLERERSQWPIREWEERMRELKRQRRSVEQMHDMTRQRDTRFPVVNAD